MTWRLVPLEQGVKTKEEERQVARDELADLLFSVLQDVRLGDENRDSLMKLRQSVSKMESLLDLISW